MTGWQGPGELLRAYGLRPKRSFGQNFLRDRAACERIAAAACPAGGSVLEIGAGLGGLTGALLERAERVVAVERDRDLVPVLRDRFGAHPGFVLREADAVRLDWLAELAGGPEPHAIAGNLPYQLTGPLLEKLASVATAIEQAVVMVQLEVADRLLAHPGNKSYGALSVFMQAAFAIERLWRVPPNAFLPAPAVASAVVRLQTLRPARARETEAFQRVVHAAFGQRRKTLRNAWRALELDDLEARAAAAGISLDARAETLAVEDFARMAATLEG